MNQNDKCNKAVIVIKQGSPSISIKYETKGEIIVQERIPPILRRRNAMVDDGKIGKKILKTKRCVIDLTDLDDMINKVSKTSLGQHTGSWSYHDIGCGCAGLCYCNPGGYCWSCCGATDLTIACSGSVAHPSARNTITTRLS
jgi:hypothetical protein